MRAAENYCYFPTKTIPWNRREAESAPGPLTKTDAGEALLTLFEQSGVSGMERLSVWGSLSEVWVGSPSELPKKVSLGALADDEFAKWAVSSSQNGVGVFIPADTTVPGLIYVQHLFSSESASFQGQCVVVLGPRAKVKLVQEWKGNGMTEGTLNPTCTGLTLIELGEDAELEMTMIQGFGTQVQGLLRGNAVLGTRSSLKATSVSFGGDRVQNRLEVSCEGRGSRLELSGVAIGKRTQVLDFWTRSHHPASDTKADVRYRTVLSEKASAVFNGSIVIPQSGARTDASQRNQNIVLSNEAKVFSLPKLEISTDDVKCAHGASTAPVSEDEVYYLMTRGITRGDAVQMIVDGFTDEVLHQIPDEAIQARLKEEMTK